MTFWVTLVTLVTSVTLVTLVISFVINSFVILKTTGCGGGGGIRTTTVDCLNVSTTPLVRYVVSTSLNEGSPSNGFELSALDVNLNVFVPFWNLNCGTGVPKGSLKKNDPFRSPTLSDINLILETVAVAPLVLPTNLRPVSIYPKNLPCASSTNEATSMFKTVDDAEYKLGRVNPVLYGLVVYTVTGELILPVLWFGAHDLTANIRSAPSYPSIVSLISNEPESIDTSINFGIISIPDVLSKNG